MKKRIRRVTFRAWLKTRIATAQEIAKNGNYYDTRLRATEREKVLKSVLKELEKANLDIQNLFKPTKA